MATYLEIDGLGSNTDLLAKVKTAALVRADAYRADGASTINQKRWAIAAMARPETEARKILPLLLVQNRALTLAQITNATDAAIQSAVDLVVPMIVAVEYP